MPLVVLFELEGVLADTAVARRDALARSFIDEGLVVPQELLARAVAGKGVRSATVTVLAELQVTRDDTATDLIALRADRYFSERLGKGISLARGARELVVALEGRATLGIVTRARRRDAELTLDLAELEGSFASVTTADDVSEQKPSPMGYRAALARLARRGLATADTVALEDGSEGIRAAHAAGVRCIAVGDVPAHEAVEAEGGLPPLAGVSVDAVMAIASRMRRVVA